MASKLSSKFGGLFLKILLLLSWVLLMLTFALEIIMVIYPNILGNGTFGVWSSTKTDSFSTLGYILLIGGLASLIFSFVIQFISKRVKFTIGRSNKIISYFSSLVFPVIIFGVLAFIGTLQINGLTIPPGQIGVNQDGFEHVSTILFYSINTNTNTFPFLIMTTSTWVWLIAIIVAGGFSLSIAFTTIKFIIRLLLNGTHDKNYSSTTPH